MGRQTNAMLLDLCELERQNDLIVTDYSSRDIEIAHLS